ncbi:hypothetical protein ACEZ3G_06075 [Maribacter algicola]|uniref:Uncharacterized protein n=1 Tax=Meishania litoralis TaxID=3434685 RepID=A0ACC7LHA0_9FLAO
MKLNDENIRFVDQWLRFSGIEYVDVRYELVDHLVTEYEQSTQQVSIEVFVKDRLKWCRSAAKDKERAMHWGIQKGLLKRFLALFKEWKILLPLLTYLLCIFFSKDLFSVRTVRFLLVAPVFLTIIAFMYQSYVKRFNKKSREQLLAAMKLGNLFALPHVFLSIFYFPSIWSVDNMRLIDNFYFMAPCILFMTLINIAAILEYREHYQRIVKEYEIIRNALA